MPNEQARKFEDAIGELVDQYLKEGMSPDVIEQTLRYQASYVLPRATELKQREPA